MDVKVDRSVAWRTHVGQLSRSGEPLIDHVDSVARALPAGSQALTYLHDIPERADQTTKVLLEHGLSTEDYGVLALLPRRHMESYRAHVMRIATGAGRTRRVARTIKLTDLNDHLDHRDSAVSVPNHAWARQQIVAAQREKGEAVSARNASFRRVA